MNQQLFLNELLKDEQNRCTKLLNQMEYDLKRLPKGSLEIKDDKFYRYLVYNEQQLHLRINEYTPDGRQLINELRYRRYIKAARPILKRKINVIRTFLKSNPLYDPLQISSKLCPQYHDLTNLPVFLDEDFDPDSWTPDNASPMYTEHLKHPSKYGLMTRSKSEAMIATGLKESGLIFQYEARLQLLYRTVRPDFKILLPHKRKFVYWEHLGKLDDPGYVLDNLTKLQDYADAGIYLGINLVITFETRENPLTYDTIRQTIEKIMNM